MSDPEAINPEAVDELEELRLTDLVETEILQEIQDGFAEIAGVSIGIRDTQGEPITRPSVISPFCRQVQSVDAGRELCRRSHQEAVQRGLREGEVVRYVCHAGLVQYAAPITVEGRRMGALVMGDRPQGRLDAARLKRLADRLGLDAGELRRQAESVSEWSEEAARRAAGFLQSVSNAIARICHQGYQMLRRLRELSSLYDLSRTLASTLDVTRILGIIAQNTADLLQAKGCSIRLLEKRAEELLVIKSWYNLSKRYRNKGPVRLEDSAIDQAALAGEIVEIADMQNDPRILYPSEAAQEGLVSGMVAGLISKDRAIGALHVYFARQRRFGRREKETLKTLAAMAAVAIENAQLYTDSRKLLRVDRELAMAAQIQRRLLPGAPPEIEGYQAAATAVPCRQVGGDFYDFIQFTPARWAIAIADVVGKGVPAALLMATARATLRSRVVEGRSPAELCRNVNRLLYEELDPSQFVTLFYAILDAETHTITSCNAGHDYPLLIRGKKIVELREGGLVIGATPRATYEQEEHRLEPGDTLALYTDGLTDARNKRGRRFGKARLVRAVRRHGDQSAGGVLRGVRNALRGFTLGMPQDDDRTLVVIRREPRES